MSFPMVLLTRLRNFARLASDERRLALRALGWLIVVRAGLRLFAFTEVRSRIAGAVRRTGAASAESPFAVRRAVLRASRTLPGTTCLAQSLVAERLLRSAGREARLSIGVATAIVVGTPAANSTATARHGSLDAHAWVESDGVLVTGDDPHDRYQLLASFGPE